MTAKQMSLSMQHDAGFERHRKPTHQSGSRSTSHQNGFRFTFLTIQRPELRVAAAL
jgi:hypothetical protein